MIEITDFSFTELISTSKVPITDNIPTSMEIVRNILNSAECLQLIRTKFGRPIIVNSGYRCELVNKLVGGVKNSNHTKGLAFDIRPQYSDLYEVLYQYCKDFFDTHPSIGDELIKYPTFIHVSFKFC